MADQQFVDDMIVKPPHPNAPDFVKASISIKRAELIAWLQAQDGDWINLDVKESRGGKWYAALNDWNPMDSRPAPERAQSQGGGGESWKPDAKPNPDEFDDSIPFITRNGCF